MPKAAQTYFSLIFSWCSFYQAILFLVNYKVRMKDDLE